MQDFFSSSCHLKWCCGFPKLLGDTLLIIYAWSVLEHPHTTVYLIVTRQHPTCFNISSYWLVVKLKTPANEIIEVNLWHKSSPEAEVNMKKYIKICMILQIRLFAALKVSVLQYLQQYLSGLITNSNHDSQYFAKMTKKKPIWEDFSYLSMLRHQLQWCLLILSNHAKPWKSYHKHAILINVFPKIPRPIIAY